MKSRNSIIAIVLIVILAGGAFMIFKPKEKDTVSNSNVENNAVYTVAQVAEHSTKSNCWTIIENNVYDITSYVSRHPGGEEILRACGTNGTSLFTNRTTAAGETVGTGTPHSSSAESQLRSLKIGSLAE